MSDLCEIMLMVSSRSSSFITWPVATSESLVVKHGFCKQESTGIPSASLSKPAVMGKIHRPVLCVDLSWFVMIQPNDYDYSTDHSMSFRGQI